MNKKWLWIGLGIIAGLFLVYQVWNQETDDTTGRDRSDFQQLESTVGTLVSRAEAEWTESEFENDNYCYYQGRKFEPDNLACAVSYSIELGEAEPADIYDFMVEQSDIVRESRIRDLRESSAARFNGHFELLDSTPCHFSTDSDPSNDETYELDCIADAEDEFYKLR